LLRSLCSLLFNPVVGRNYLFECPRCGYRARVAGGVSDGAWFVVSTLRCHQCKELHDAVVEMKFPLPPLREPRLIPGLRSSLQLKRLTGLKHPPTFQAAINRLPPTGAKSYRWLKFPLACPISPRHRVEPWKTPGKCPKCDWFLESSSLPFRSWD
jgi:hypothetical protein